MSRKDKTVQQRDLRHFARARICAVAGQPARALVRTALLLPTQQVTAWPGREVLVAWAPGQGMLRRVSAARRLTALEIDLELVPARPRFVALDPYPGTEPVDPDLGPGQYALLATTADAHGPDLPCRWATAVRGPDGWELSDVRPGCPAGLARWLADLPADTSPEDLWAYVQRACDPTALPAPESALRTVVSVASLDAPVQRFGGAEKEHKE